MNKASNIARGGFFTALGVLFIYLSTVSPTSKIYFLGIASAIIPLSIITTKIKNSVFVYVATSLLSLLLIGVKGTVITYILFFGIYGFAKFYIEKLRNMLLEIFLKLLCFNISIGTAYLLFKTFFTELFSVNISIYAALAMLQIVFLIFDYALTVFIAYINRRFIK